MRTGALWAFIVAAAICLGAQAVDTTPPVISGTSVSQITDNSAVVRWTTNEVAYGQVEYGTTVAYGFTCQDTFQSTSVIIFVIGLQPNTLYHYRVRSKDLAGNISYSGDFTFTTLALAPDSTPPSRPILSATVASDTQVNLSWSASVDNPSGSGVAGYRIFQQGANIATVTGTSYQRTGLSPVTTYSFEVEAFDNNGNPDAVLNSNRSNKVVITTSGTIPDPAGKTPTFTATPASLNFQATANGPIPALQSLTLTNTGTTTMHYQATADQAWLRLWLGILGDSQKFGAQLSVGSTQFTTLYIFADPAGLSAGTYTGNVTVTNVSGGAGQTKIPVTFTVAATGSAGIYPTQLLSLNKTSLTLSCTQWGIGQSGKIVDTIIATNLSASQGLGFMINTNASWLGGDSSVGLSANRNTTLAFRVKPWGMTPGVYTTNIIFTVYNGNYGRIVVPVTLTVYPEIAAPTNLSVGNPTVSSLQATWTAPAGAVAGYRIDVSTDASFSSSFMVLRSQDVGNVTSYIIPSLQPQTKYYVRLVAYGAGGTTSPSTPTVFGITSASGTSFSLSVLKSGTGSGTVTLNPPGGSYAAGTQVTLTAAAGSGSVFAGWSGGASGSANPLTITINANTTITSTFNLSSVNATLTVNVSGSGLVTLNPPGGTYPAGTQVTLTANPAAGSAFAGWSGGASGTTNPLTITLNSNLNVTAAFHASAAQQLPPVVTSQPSAAPNPAQVGQVVAFSVAASDPDGGNVTTFEWNFGDGATNGSASTIHTYSVAGTYNVVVKVIDLSGLSVSASVNVVVNADGTGGGSGGGQSGTPMTIAKFMAKMNFAAQSRDKIAFSGVLPNVPAGVAIAGAQLMVNVNNVTETFNLDSHARGKSARGTVALKLKKGKHSKGQIAQFAGGDVSIVVSFKNETSAAAWGIDTTADSKNAVANLGVTIEFGNIKYIATIVGQLTVKAGKTGFIKK